ncbi:MAG: YciI family protein [Ethanoligenens sp.]
MFLANLTYIRPMDEVESHLKEHIAFLDKYYQAGNFICSGRKIPRTGGVILMNAKNMDEVQQIISEDPFHINQLADYEIIEFDPVKYAPDFRRFANQQL